MSPPLELKLRLRLLEVFRLDVQDHRPLELEVALMDLAVPLAFPCVTVHP